jgi:hypothetical protein
MGNYMRKRAVKYLNGDAVVLFRGALRHALDSKPDIAIDNPHFLALNTPRIATEDIARAMQMPPPVIEKALNYLTAISATELVDTQASAKQKLDVATRARDSLRKHVKHYDLITLS